ncbi:MAG: hypothetical protein CYG61_10075 [Actinobacteria bacterium]|nr:MAG: hypothetical protein CYG61_10075 [Actinomycetota bacterium]
MAEVLVNYRHRARSEPQRGTQGLHVGASEAGEGMGAEHGQDVLGDAVLDARCRRPVSLEELDSHRAACLAGAVA